MRIRKKRRYYKEEKKEDAVKSRTISNRKRKYR